MNSVKIDGINQATVALFEGSLAAVWGLALAIYVSILSSAFGYVVTDSFLQSLLFGLGTSAWILVIVPVLYFAIGGVIGYCHALVFNGFVSAFGGIELGTGEQPTEPEAGTKIAQSTEQEENVFYPRSNKRAATFGERIPTPEERHLRSRKL